MAPEGLSTEEQWSCESAIHSLLQGTSLLGSSQTEVHAMNGSCQQLDESNEPRGRWLWAPLPDRRCWSLLAMIFCCWLAQPLVAQTALNEELTISSGVPTETEIRVFNSGLLYVSHVETGAVHIQQGIPFDEGTTSLQSTVAAEQRHPAISISLSGALTVIYEESDPSSSVGSAIVYRSSVGGGFAPPVELIPDPLDDEGPRVAAPAGFDGRDVIWTRRTGQTSQVVFSQNLSTEEIVAEGEDPDLASLDGINHQIAFVRNAAVYHIGRANGQWGTETQISSNLANPTDPHIACDLSGAVHIAFLASGAAWYVRKAPGGGFTAPIEVSTGVTDVSEVGLAVGEAGNVSLFYISQGDIWHRAGAVGIFGPITNLSQTPADPEDLLAVAIDSLDSFHLIYRRGGLLRYRNSVTPPAASFVTSPGVGEFPLEVEFVDFSTGVIESWHWDLGDGTTSTEQQPLHVYDDEGTYEVTLTVSGPGGTDSLTIADAVIVGPPSNVMRIPSILVIQSQPDVVIPVLATHPEPAQGYQIGLTWDSDALLFYEATIIGTAVEALAPDFLVVNEVPGPNGAEGLTMGAIFSTIPPLDGRTLAPGVDQRILHLRFDVQTDANPNEATVIQFDDTIGRPPILNIFTVAGTSRRPFLIDGEVFVDPFVFPPPVPFLRGDVDGDSQVLITDAVLVLQFLFSGGAAPACFDAADVNDSGSIDLADPIGLLGYLFIFTNPPAYPWPSSGFDGTEDDLGDC